MCTAINWTNGDTYFGRNMDIDFVLEPKLVIVPRNYTFMLKKVPNIREHFAIMGMAVVVDDYPLFCDAVNEKGLCLAGLNFTKFAQYSKIDESKDNIAVHELYSWILGQCEDTYEAQVLLEKINIVPIPFNSSLPVADLHFMLSDKKRSLVIECTKDGLKVHVNKTGVLTNSPPIDFHLNNLSNYLNLTPKQPKKSYCLGLGAVGLPGDFSSASRFIKANFIKKNMVCEQDKHKSIMSMFSMLGSIAMVSGSVLSSHGGTEATSYSVCIDTKELVYYIKTYYGSKINAFAMNNVDLNSDNILVYDIDSDFEVDYSN